MISVSRRLLAFSALAIGVPAGAQADAGQPQQTVENAQKFLAMILPGNIYHSTLIATLEQRLRQQFPNARFNFTGEARLVDTSVKARCVSMMKYDGSAVQIHYFENGQWIDRSPWPDSMPDVHALGDDVGIDWGKDVKSVSADGTEVTIVFSKSDNPIIIDMNDKGLASRVGFAMQYLHSSCDPTASTGF